MKQQESRRYSGTIFPAGIDTENTAVAKWILQDGDTRYPLVASESGKRRRWLDVPQYSGRSVVLSGTPFEGSLTGCRVERMEFQVSPRTVKSIVVINGEEQAEVHTESGKINIAGTFVSKQGGLYQFGSILALVGFAGQISAPKSVVVELHFREKDLEQAKRQVFGPNVEKDESAAMLSSVGRGVDPEVFLQVVRQRLKPIGRDFLFGPDPADDPGVLHHRQRGAEAARFPDVTSDPQVGNPGSGSTSEQLGRMLVRRIAMAPNVAGPDRQRLIKGISAGIEMDRETFKALADRRTDTRRALGATYTVSGMLLQTQIDELQEIAERSAERHADSEIGNIPDAVLELFRMSERPIESVGAMTATLGPVAGFIIAIIATLSVVTLANLRRKDRQTIEQVQEKIRNAQGTYEPDIEDVSNAAQLTSAIANLEENRQKLKEAGVGSIIMGEADAILRYARGVKEKSYTDVQKKRHFKRAGNRMKRAFEKAGVPFDREMRMKLNSAVSGPLADFRQGVIDVDMDKIASALTEMTVDCNTMGRDARKESTERINQLIDDYANSVVSERPDWSPW